MSWTDFTCRSGGSNLNAGTLDGAAEAATAAIYTSVGDSDGTSVFTPSGGTNPVSAGVVVGQFGSVYVTAGATVAVFVGRITNVVNAVNGAITFSTTAKSGTFPAASGGAHTITCRVGGAWLGMNGTVGFPMTFITQTLTNAAGNPPFVNYKNDQTYSVTTSITPNGGTVGHGGYTTTFRDLGKATLDGGTSGAAYHLLVMSNAQGTVWQDWIFQNNGASSTNDLMRNTLGVRASRCVFAHSRGNGFNGNNCVLVECEAYDCNQSNTSNQAGFNATGASLFVRCVSHDNLGSNSYGFYSGFGASFVECVADTNGAAGWKLDQNTPNQQSSLLRCVAYNNAGDGVLNANSVQAVYIESCIFSLNGGFGVKDNSNALLYLESCAFHANTSGQVSSAAGYTTNNNPITLSSSPFLNPASGDFRLNVTANAGALCRNTGRGTFTETAASYTGTVGFPDVGAAQHQNPTLPTQSQVISGVAYGDGGTQFIGNVVLPVVQDVHSGIHYGANGFQYTGTLTTPAVTDVRLGVQYGGDGTEFTGTLVVNCDYPAPAVVLAGVSYSGGALIGTLVCNAYDTSATGFQVGVDDIIAQLLVNMGLGSSPAGWETGTGGDWPVQSGGEPPQPDETITVYETTPVIFGKLQIDGDQLEHYGFTIRVRGSTKASARQKAADIREVLTKNVYHSTVTLTGASGQPKSYVVFAVSKCTLVPVGTEAPDSKRWLVNLNCVASILPQPIST